MVDIVVVSLMLVPRCCRWNQYWRPDESQVS
ncbi:uncharacterized protein METZ01_LOCUS172545 [marine metagenome]|uniref:Uncharacterized protein n=1 Tax=marine metagenome TaxID=408172 RepID=A0A382C1S8_9ZZZZ